MLLEAHLAGPSHVEPPLDHLLAEPLRRRQRKAFSSVKKKFHAVALLEPFQFLDRAARLLLPEILVVQRQRAEGAILVVAAAGELHGQHRLRGEMAASGKPS